MKKIFLLLTFTFLAVISNAQCDAPKLQVHPYGQFYFQPASIVRWTKDAGVDAYRFQRGDGSTFIWQDCSITADKGWESFISYQYSYYSVSGTTLKVRAYCIPYCSKVYDISGGYTFGYDAVNLSNPANWSGWSNEINVK